MKTTIWSILLSVGFVFFSLSNTFAQDDYYEDTTEQSIPFKDRLYTGGSGGFGISSGILYLAISPMVGYKITDQWSAGVSARYVYYGPSSTNSYIQSFKYYGAGMFTRYQFTPSLLGTIEYERLNVQNINPISSDYGKRVWANVLMVGGAYTASISQNIKAQIFLLYDLIDDPNSPYRYNYIFSGPNGLPIIYRVGVSVGF